MAKNYAEMSTEELQKLAEDQKNRRAAIRELAQSGADPSILSSLGGADRQAFLKEREQKRVDDWHAANDKARATRMKGILGEEGGRYSPVTIANARKYLEENGYGQEGERRRQFDVTNETTRKVSENEMNGKINYGKGAAKVKAGADVTMNKNEWETRAKIAEKEAAARKYLANQDAATRKYGIDAEHGKIGEDGKVTPGSRERTAQIQGQDQLRIEQERGKTALAQTEIQSLNAQLDRESRERVAQITASGKYDSAKVISAAKTIQAALLNVTDPNERAKIIAKYKEDNKDDPAAIAAADALGGGGTEQFAR